MDKSENGSLIYFGAQLSTKDIFWSSSPFSDLVHLDPRKEEASNNEICGVS